MAVTIEGTKWNMPDCEWGRTVAGGAAWPPADKFDWLVYEIECDWLVPIEIRLFPARLLLLLLLPPLLRPGVVCCCCCDWR